VPVISPAHRHPPIYKQDEWFNGSRLATKYCTTKWPTSTSVAMISYFYIYF